MIEGLETEFSSPLAKLLLASVSKEITGLSSLSTIKYVILELPPADAFTKELNSNLISSGVPVAPPSYSSSSSIAIDMEADASPGPNVSNVEAPEEIALPALVERSKSSSVSPSLASLSELPIPIVAFIVNSVFVVPFVCAGVVESVSLNTVMVSVSPSVLFSSVLELKLNCIGLSSSCSFIN